MKMKIVKILLLLAIIVSCKQNVEENNVPLAPKENSRPDNFQPFNYKHSLKELKDNFSKDMMEKARVVFEKMKKVNDEGKWKPTPESLDIHCAPEWFMDAKLGMFIDWGLWSVAGWAPKKEKGAMYPDWYELEMERNSLFLEYHTKNWGSDFKRDDFIPLFSDAEYNPDKLVQIAKDAGMKYVVPFAKHHSGFALWPSSFTQRNSVNMGPQKDLILPLMESCRKHGLKFGFYFSVEEWEYPLIDNQGNLIIRKWGGEIEPYSNKMEKLASGKIAVKNFAKDYLVPQAIEFIDRYDPDILWYDGDWDTNVLDLHTYDIASYFYNNAQGRKDVAVNDRYGGNIGEKWLRSKRGDFFTNEFGDMQEHAVQTFHAWEECRGISQSYGYNWQDTENNVISMKEFVDMFIDIVSYGGNLLLIVNLDGKGDLPEILENRLNDIGRWLKVNGEGIYNSRPYKVQTENYVSYTQSKDGQFTYAVIKEWPGHEMFLKNVSAKDGSKIKMLGYDKPIEWINTNKGLSIKFPEKLQNEKDRPCEYAWILRIESSDNQNNQNRYQ